MFSKFAIIVTAFGGIVKVVVALLASANTTPFDVVVQFLNRFPAGGVPANIVTVAPLV